MSEEKPEDPTVRVPPSEHEAPPPPPPPPPPPGGAGFPPPGGFPPPPPGTAGWATRYGLVRPARGRVLAGVCAAIGRATNTDPVLWRVLFAVLTLAGGVSIFVYLVAWLLIPAEGDTGSPLEALFGRGRSSTSPLLVIVVGVIGLLAVGSALTHHSAAWLIVGALIVGGLVLANRNRTTPLIPPAAGPPPGYQPPGYPPPGYQPPPTYPVDETVVTDPAADPMASTAAGTGTGYRPPFAPHGPFATSPYPYPGPGGPPPPPPPVKPVRPPSRLGRFTLSLGLLGIGIVALFDAVNHGRVPFAAYVAVALATVGLGLVIGAWLGRARGLIALGVVLSVLLAISSAAGEIRGLHGSAGNVIWAPANMTELSDRYEHGVGDTTLDLSQLSFDGLDKTVTVRVGAGNLHVQVPPKVDVVVHAKVNVGNANVFSTHWDGINNPERTVTDNDTDGAGGGHLTLDLRINAGDLEVSR